MRIRGLLYLLLPVLALPTGCSKETKPVDLHSSRPLVVLIGSDVTSFDPQIPFDESTVVLGNIFQHLVEFDAMFQLSPGLATRWTNPDDRTWRFYLNREARFSDGNRLKASDVKFSIERLKGMSLSDLQGFTEHIDSVDVVDDFTVDIKTDTPFSILNNLVFISIMNQKYVNSVNEKIGELPMGTGPYRLEEWERKKRIVLTLNTHYKPMPHIPRVEFVINEDGEKVLDMILKIKPNISNVLPFRKIEDFQKKKPADQKIVAANGIAVYYVILSTKPGLPDFTSGNPLADVRVRRALACTTDPAEFVRNLSKGFGRVPTQMVAPEIFGYDPSIPQPDFNPEKAKKLLAEAGYSDLTIPIYSTEEGTHRFEKIVIEQWAKAGVKGVLQLLSDEEYSVKQQNGDLAASITGYSCSSGDAAEILSFHLHTRNLAMTYGKGNYAYYSNPEVDRIVENNLRTFNPMERRQMLQKAMRIIRDEVPYLPLLIFDDVYTVSDQIVWTPPVSGDIHVSDISFKQ